MYSRVFPILLLSLLLNLHAFGQEEKTEEPEKEISMAIVEKLPLMEGCAENLPAMDQQDCFSRMAMQHVANNFKYPKKARKRGVQGKIFVQFVIDTEANITKVKILRGISQLYTKKKDIEAAKLCEEEALRVVNILKVKKPGYQRGKAVNVQYNLPISLRLD